MIKENPLPSEPVLVKLSLSLASNVLPKDVDHSLKWLFVYSFIITHSGHFFAPLPDIDKHYLDLSPFKDWLLEKALNKQSPLVSLGEKMPLLQEQYASFLNNQNSPLYLEENRLYLHKSFQLEKKLAHFLKQRKVERTNSISPPDFTNYLQKHYSMILHKEQIQAINHILTQSFCLLSGGPGSGKTTLLFALLRAIQLGATESPVKIYLAAPTGRAASRIEESLKQWTAINTNSPFFQELEKRIPEKAYTLHQLFDLKGGVKTFERKETLLADWLIIDESSMIDGDLFLEILKKTNRQTKLLFLGDPFQLPPVGGTNIFSLLLPENEQSYFKANTCTLTHSHRSKGSLQPFIQSFLEEEEEKLSLQLEKNQIQKWQPIDSFSEGVSFFKTSFEDEKGLPQLIDHLILNNSKERLEEPKKQRTCFQKMHQTKVLTLKKIGPLGAKQINRHCLEKIPSHSPYPIIFEENDYTHSIFNGDLGIYVPGEGVTPQIYVEQEKELQSYQPENLKTFTPSFAMTVHKAQGSEYDNIILILPPTPIPLLTKEILYTAISRAKKRLILVGDISIFLHGLKKRIKQYSHLMERIKKAPN